MPTSNLSEQLFNHKERKDYFTRSREEKGFLCAVILREVAESRKN
jgi:hypothetical protein